MNAPCKDCEKRTVGCHGHCEAYQAFTAAKQEEYAKRAKMQAVNDYSDNKERQLRRSMLKKAKRPGY